MILSVSPISVVNLPANQQYLEEAITTMYAEAISQSLFKILPGEISFGDASRRAQAIVEFEARVAAAIPPNTIFNEPEVCSR